MGSKEIVTKFPMLILKSRCESLMALEPTPDSEKSRLEKLSLKLKFRPREATSKLLLLLTFQIIPPAIDNQLLELYLLWHREPLYVQDMSCDCFL